MYKALVTAVLLASATALDVVVFDTGGATLDLGGASTSSSSGIIYRSTANQDWSSLDMSNNPFPCAFGCDNFHTYTLPDVGDAQVGICTLDENGDAGTAADCVPGHDYTCRFSFSGPGGGIATFKSTTDTSMFGLGSQIATLCGGTI
ncbi:hypothetical protein NKR19_g3070 [Coniochaeta hoffmannii]|uniref:Uncharacterized protein n=1 Tax=Coniochaeta hoffmannii TaxID=91930 RepID=A0AA38RV53_9PEZI|nr:hypothetical protein NKR19_g3070 [Coniochaeta hoffmannii]